MATKSNVIEFPIAERIAKREQWEQEWEEAVSYYGANPARRTSKHFEWWEHILWTNQEHFKRYPRSFADKLMKRYGALKTDFWWQNYEPEAVIEIFSFHEFMEHIRG